MGGAGVQIFIEQNKGDFIFAEWIEEDMAKRKDKIKELEDNSYALDNVDLDYMNQYEIYKNKEGHEVVVTTLCC